MTAAVGAFLPPALLLVFSLSAASCKKKAPVPIVEKFAVMETSMGTVTMRLFSDLAPKTVAHFIGLAAGKKQWRDPADGKVRYDPIYDGLLIHRVVPGFMIQTGDPTGKGDGGIGYTIPDEFNPKLRYDRPGLVGMVNFGPNTNGSQFFITISPYPDLNDRHTLFGEVVEGADVVKAISKVPRDEHESSNRPLKPVLVRSVRIVDRTR